MTSFRTDILLTIVCWMMIPLLLVYMQRRMRWPSAGLLLSYIGSLFVGHAPGAFVYSLPWYRTNYEAYLTFTGHTITLIGLISLISGYFVTNLFWSRQLLPTVPEAPSLSKTLHNPYLPLLLFLIGWASFLGLDTILASLPSGTSLAASLTNLRIVAIALGIYQSLENKNYRLVILWAISLPLIPFFSVTSDGFIGHGIAAMLTVGTFIFANVRLRWWYPLVIPIVFYFFLSLCITYLAGRTEIRNAVWGGENYTTRLTTLGDEFSSWEWFNWRDPDHLWLLDVRLNQNYLLGASIIYLENGVASYAQGETLVQAVAAFVPRAIWPEKPAVAGGSDLVTRFTGIQFYGETSVGMGQVMEFNANFGIWGVIIGFFITGCIITIIDRMAMIWLKRGNFYIFLLWYLPGIAILQPIGRISEMTAGFASALVTAFIINVVVKRLFDKPQAQPLPFATPLRQLKL